MSHKPASAIDLHFMQRAIELASAAALESNLPIAALVVREDKVIAEAGNKVLSPEFHPVRHAEVEALNQIPGNYLHQYSRSMALYTTQEPCIMCLGAIILYRIGKVVFGGKDPKRGATYLLNQLGDIYERSLIPEVVGPIMPDVCDPLFARADQIYRTHRDSTIDR